jgi:hypothetical protein
MKRPIGFLLLFAAAACAPAQVTLSTVQNGVATLMGDGIDFGKVPIGSVADVQFRLTNTGSQSVYLTNLAIKEQLTPPYLPSFSVACALSPDLCGSSTTQQLNIKMSSEGTLDSTLDFTVQFQPSQVGSKSAEITVNANPSKVLSGTGVPGLTVLLNNQPLAAGQTLSFGSVQVGSSQTVKLTLSNKTGASLNLPAFPVPSGGDFTLGGAALSTPAVADKSSVELDVIFTPHAAGVRNATLTIGLLSYPLQGTGLAAPPLIFPTASMQLNLVTQASAQQGSIGVNLASASPSSGTGTITLSFQSSVAGVSDDAAIAFADGSRSASFTILQGASAGQFSGAAGIAFGTGTTAGTLNFSLHLGASTTDINVPIAGAEIGVDAAVAARNVQCAPTLLYCTATNIELQLNGWDNTRSISQLEFSFFDAAGNAIAPGTISVAAASAFQQYFAASTLGGVFGVHALFPVNGDSNQVVTAQVALVNSAGTAQTAKITF